VNRHSAVAESENQQYANQVFCCCKQLDFTALQF